MNARRVWQALAGLIAGCILVTAAAAIEPVRESRAVNQSFDSVRLVGALDLVLTQSDTTSLVIEARPDLQSRIKTEVRNGELVLRYESPIEIHLGFSSNLKGPRALLSVKALKRIALEGSGDVTATNWNTNDNLELSIAGSGDVTISNLTAREVHSSLAGSGDIRLAGTVSASSIDISGAGDYDAGNLRSGAVSVSIAGSGDVVVWAERSLSVSIAGSGDVAYYGKPTISQSIAGSGEIEARGDKH